MFVGYLDMTQEQRRLTFFRLGDGLYCELRSGLCAPFLGFTYSQYNRLVDVLSVLCSLDTPKIMPFSSSFSF